MIMFRHILPNSLSPIITFLPFSISGAIMALVGLDFLGFGLNDFSGTGPALFVIW
jgi:microcin C transport system permease protein